MSDDVRKAIQAIKGHLADMQAEVRANSRDVKKMAARLDNVDGHLTEIQGSFASIETHLIKAADSNDTTGKRLDAVEARLDKLEKKKAS